MTKEELNILSKIKVRPVEEQRDFLLEQNMLLTGKIATLEKENADLKQQIVQLKKDVIENESDCANCGLRQENTELKGLVNQYKASKCGSISLVNRNMIMSDQLTKATELLKRCYENYIYLEPFRSEIEQFLKEIEK